MSSAQIIAEQQFLKDANGFAFVDSGVHRTNLFKWNANNRLKLAFKVKYKNQQ